MPTTDSLVPGVPAATAELLLSWLGVGFTLVLAPVVGWGVRRALDAAGLRAPRPEHGGLDWSRVAGLVATLAVLAVGLPAWVGPGAGPELRRLVQLLGSIVRPLALPAFVLAMADHTRRGLVERAARGAREERPELDRRAEQIRTGGLVVAGLTLMGDGLWGAWPLALGALLLWAMHDRTVRPLFDRWVADLRAGRALRSDPTFSEGATLQLEGERVTLAGPVGMVDTRVTGGSGERVVRNVVLLGSTGGTLAEPPPAAEPPAPA